MRQLSIIFLFFSISSSFCQGNKINLTEIEVKEKAIPEIIIQGTKYSYRDRDYLIKRVLTLPFWSKDFVIKMDLSYFYNNREDVFLLIEGETEVKIDSKILLRNHKFRTLRKIKKLIPEIKEVSINQTNLFIIEKLSEIYMMPVKEILLKPRFQMKIKTSREDL